MPEAARPALPGVRVVVTRPRHQQGQLVSALHDQGAESITLPMIDIVEVPSGVVELRLLLERADELSWLVVTSPNGARVVSILHEEGCALPPIAALGTATAEAIGHSVEFVSHRATVASLVDDFPEGAGLVIVVQGDLADETLSAGLAAKGWAVQRCNVYRTVDTEPNDEDLRAALDADAVVLASGSAVPNCARLVGGDFGGVVVVIGPVTAAAAQEAGLVVSAVAEEPTVDGLVSALGSALSP